MANSLLPHPFSLISIDIWSLMTSMINLSQKMKPQRFETWMRKRRKETMRKFQEKTYLRIWTETTKRTNFWIDMRDTDSTIRSKKNSTQEREDKSIDF